jgi:hypothetical protein
MTRNASSFQPGNTAALKHGGRSPRVRAQMRAELSQGIRDQILTRWPHLADQGPLLDLLVDCLSDVRQLRDYVDAHGGPVGERGRLLKPMEMLRAREHDALAIADRLLLAPREVARLGPAFGIRTPQQQLTAAAQARIRERAAQSSPEHTNGHGGALSAPGASD